ncbi:flavodoxin family protein [Anaerocolumna xylanovorans]|uniref:Flavodoxin n=1 Tax=Anaerocolumna xylanovorans DSM 12503 TaxID=1121345 RepID=A0A1M7Y190_9FIRM|nr:flavodoxin family protein [Anaerocolumna xylanovorans]SHO45346.1 Flavodoxin [Anaerocolumna xylanovorans DSM 12503]
MNLDNDKEQMRTKIVVIYYSVGNNTKRIAEKIQKEIGADIARIDTVIPYKVPMIRL